MLLLLLLLPTMLPQTGRRPLSVDHGSTTGSRGTGCAREGPTARAAPIPFWLIMIIGDQQKQRSPRPRGFQGTHKPVYRVILPPTTRSPYKGVWGAFAIASFKGLIQRPAGRPASQIELARSSSNSNRRSTIEVFEDRAPLVLCANHIS
uniref:Putative secreted protein n=1 Tax=Anopheles darlingi TaxID=43151 RepID=A0A2M4DPI0_ANODA